MSLKNCSSIKITHKGIEYPCVYKNGKITVRAKRTAKGQYLLAGTFDPKTKTWSNDNGNTPLPKHVKNEVERIFS